LRTVFIGENIGELEMEESQSNGCDWLLSRSDRFTSRRKRLINRQSGR
jgi:hypothetical protein